MQNIDRSVTMKRLESTTAVVYGHELVTGISRVRILVPMKICRVEGADEHLVCRGPKSYRWRGVIVRREVPAQVSPSLLDHSSKLRGSSPKALM
ncbi:hypothetical protein TNCV_4867871 [Trichonephila clavipes]|nr:hypothetical protein TNCV_4867871 [Trichonephila clavipes]